MPKKKRVKYSHRPLKIIPLYTIGEDGYIQRIEYWCDGVIKYANIAYLNVDFDSTIWEEKHIIRWLEKFHPDRTHIIDDPYYDYMVKTEILHMDPNKIYEAEK